MSKKKQSPGYVQEIKMDTRTGQPILGEDGQQQSRVRPNRKLRRILQAEARKAKR